MKAMKSSFLKHERIIAAKGIMSEMIKLPLAVYIGLFGVALLVSD